MDFKEKLGIVIMLSAISVSIGYPDAPWVIDCLRPIGFLTGILLFSLGGDYDRQ